eukprot:904348-Pelagomonas_calceolata.AAC.9
MTTQSQHCKHADTNWANPRTSAWFVAAWASPPNVHLHSATSAHIDLNAVTAAHTNCRATGRSLSSCSAVKSGAKSNASVSQSWLLCAALTAASATADGAEHVNCVWDLHILNARACNVLCRKVLAMHAGRMCLQNIQTLGAAVHSDCRGVCNARRLLVLATRSDARCLQCMQTACACNTLRLQVSPSDLAAHANQTRASHVPCIRGLLAHVDGNSSGLFTHLLI